MNVARHCKFNASFISEKSAIKGAFRLISSMRPPQNRPVRCSSSPISCSEALKPPSPNEIPSDWPTRRCFKCSRRSSFFSAGGSIRIDGSHSSGGKSQVLSRNSCSPVKISSAVYFKSCLKFKISDGTATVSYFQDGVVKDLRQ